MVSCSPFSSQGEIETVVADTSKRILALLERAADTKTLQRVVAMLPGEVTQEVKDKAKETGVEIITITDLEVRSQIFSSQKFLVFTKG